MLVAWKVEAEAVLLPLQTRFGSEMEQQHRHLDLVEEVVAVGPRDRESNQSWIAVSLVDEMKRKHCLAEGVPASAL